MKEDLIESADVVARQCSSQHFAGEQLLLSTMLIFQPEQSCQQICRPCTPIFDSYCTATEAFISTTLPVQEQCDVVLTGDYTFDGNKVRFTNDIRGLERRHRISDAAPPIGITHRCGNSRYHPFTWARHNAGAWGGEKFKCLAWPGREWRKGRREKDKEEKFAFLRTAHCCLPPSLRRGGWTGGATKLIAARARAGGLTSRCWRQPSLRTGTRKEHAAAAAPRERLSRADGRRAVANRAEGA